MNRMTKMTGVVLLALALTVAAGCGSKTVPDQAGEQHAGSAGSPKDSSAPADNASNPAPPQNNGNSGAATNGNNGPAQASEPADQKVLMNHIASVRLIDPSSGWIGGSGWIARTDDGGKQWKIQYAGGQTVEQLFALNGKEAWAVLGPIDGTDGRKLLRTTDGGAHWSPAGTVPNGGFLHFTSAQEAFAANAYSADGGTSWSTLPVPDHLVGDAYFHDRKNGWAATQDNGKIMVKRTVDGGATWSTVMTRESVAPPTGAVIRSAGKDDAWVEWIGDSGMSQTSYSLFHTEDGGAHWTTAIANSTAGGGPAPGFPLNDTTGPHNEGSKPGALYVASPKVAFMGGYCPACDNPNTVGWTTDGGKTWNNGKEQLPGFGGALLAIDDASHGWLITNDHDEPSVMYATSDGGKHWDKVHTFDRAKF